MTGSACGCCSRPEPVTPSDARIADAIRALLAGRDAAASICPSEVARQLWSDAAWRDAMPDVRRVARGLAIADVIVITRADTVLDPHRSFEGPVRLRRGRRWPDDASND